MTIMIANIAAVIVNCLFHRQFHKNLNIEYAGLKELRQRKDGLSRAEQRANNLCNQLTQTQKDLSIAKQSANNLSSQLTLTKNSLTDSRADVATLRRERDEAVAAKGRCEKKLHETWLQWCIGTRLLNHVLRST